MCICYISIEYIHIYIYVLSVFVIFFRLIVLHKLMPSEGATRLTARIISRLSPQVDVMSNGLCKILLYKCCHVPLVHGGVWYVLENEIYYIVSCDSSPPELFSTRCSFTLFLHQCWHRHTHIHQLHVIMWNETHVNRGNPWVTRHCTFPCHLINAQ